MTCLMGMSGWLSCWAARAQALTLTTAGKKGRREQEGWREGGRREEVKEKEENGCILGVGT